MKGVIMIIDDDDDDRELFKEALYEISPEITCLKALDGVDALQMLSGGEHLPDIIFLDLNMPQINGRECLQILKQHDQLKDIPVIIYSTSKTEENVQQAMAAGAAG